MRYPEYIYRLVVICFLLGSPHLLLSQSDVLASQSLFAEGIKLLEAENYGGAERRFKAMLKQDKDLASAYYGLGVVCFRRRPTRLLDARLYLRTALQKDPNYVDAWVELGKVEERYWPEEALDVYQKAVTAIPGNKYLYSKFIEYALWRKEKDRTLETLTELVKSYPDIPEYLMNLAEAYLVQEKHAESVSVLDSLELMFPEFAPSRRQLLSAKIYFDSDYLEEGHAYYEAAMNSISDGTDARVFLDDIKYIMEDDEYHELIRTPIDSLGEYYHRFWRSRDPNMATIENERIPTHYQRIIFAIRHFSMLSDQSDEMESFYEAMHPYSQYNTHGNELLKLSYFPEALVDGREFDDLGLIFIRHGWPNMQITASSGLPSYVDAGKLALTMAEVEELSDFSLRNFNVGYDTSIVQAPVPGYDIVVENMKSYHSPRADMGETLMSPGYLTRIPMNLTWKYYLNADRPEMVFHFKRFGGTRGWIVESIPHVIADRELMDHQYYDLGRESFSPSPSPARIGELTRRIEAINREYVNIGMKSETSDFKYEAEPLDLPHRFLSFKGEDGRNQVEFYYLISGQEVQLYKTTTVNFLKLAQFIGFYDDEWHESVRYEEPYIRKVPFNSEVWKTQALVEKNSFEVLPGEYSYEMHMKDEVSEKLAVYRGGYEVRDYWQNGLLMSDILLSGVIGFESDGSTFSRGGIYYSPHMFSSYDQGEEVGLYFELYNLLLDDVGQTKFRVECTLQPFGTEDPSAGRQVIGFFRNLIGSDDSSVSTSYDYIGYSMDQEVFMNIDLGDERPGHYELLVEAKDLNSDRKIIEKIDFWVR